MGGVTEEVTFEWDGGSVSGAWHHPPQGRDYVVLAHGAGGNLHTPGLIRYAEALAGRGVGAVRFNFLYSEAGRKIPDPPARLEACFRAVAETVRTRSAALYLGGRSMGGRIASHLVAGGFAAKGLIFLSYPLHSPGQPDRLRTSHLTNVGVPMLFLQGSQDAFARMNLLRSTLKELPTATLHVLDGADHGLRIKGRPEEEVLAELADVTVAWMQGRRR
ncbi:MAG: alpha/beta hydrolase family protein [bacterium]